MFYVKFRSNALHLHSLLPLACSLFSRYFNLYSSFVYRVAWWRLADLATAIFLQHLIDVGDGWRCLGLLDLSLALGCRLHMVSMNPGRNYMSPEPVTVVFGHHIWPEHGDSDSISFCRRQRAYNVLTLSRRVAWQLLGGGVGPQQLARSFGPKASQVVSDFNKLRTKQVTIQSGLLAFTTGSSINARRCCSACSNVGARIVWCMNRLACSRM